MYTWFLVFLSLLHLEIAYKAHVLAIYDLVGPLGLYTLGEFAASVKQKNASHISLQKLAAAIVSGHVEVLRA